MALQRARRLRIAWWLAFAGVVVFYLVTAHRAHLSGLREWLPLVVLLACPLMHLFGHHHHGPSGRSGKVQEYGRDADQQVGFRPR